MVELDLLVKGSNQRKGTMTIRRTFQGAWEISMDDTRGYNVTRQYFGYTKREAMRLFREDLKILNSK